MVKKMLSKTIKTGNIAIPAMGKTMGSFICDNLGRAPFIIIFSIENKTYECFKNFGFEIQDGSGLKVAELIAANKANILLTKEIGQKAYSVLMKEHIDVHLLKSIGTVKAVVDRFLND